MHFILGFFVLGYVVAQVVRAVSAASAAGRSSRTAMAKSGPPVCSTSNLASQRIQTEIGLARVSADVPDEPLPLEPFAARQYVVAALNGREMSRRQLVESLPHFIDPASVVAVIDGLVEDGTIFETPAGRLRR